MFAEGRTRVITKEAGSKSVKLADVLEDERWKDAVEMSPMKSCYLTEVPYADFRAAPGSLVLSYRWESEVDVSCAVADPAGAVAKLEGRVNLGFLLTPALDWTHLWVDFLCHLNDGEGWSYCRETLGPLYLENTVLPQYFLLESPEKVEEAFTRGWLHQELSCAALHRGAVEALIEIACGLLREELPYKMWFKGLPWKFRALRLLRAFCEKRPLLVDGWEGAEGNCKFHCDGWDDVWQTTGWYAAIHQLKWIPIQFGSLPEEITLKEKKKNLDKFLDIACMKQVPDDPEEVMEDLPVSSIIHAFSMSNYWDAGDMYVAPLAVFNAACGLPVRDPLKEFRLRHASGPNRPQNANGSLRFEASDLDLEALNGNFKLLQICWRQAVEENLKPLVYHDHHEVVVDGAERPPGTMTLGIGPLPRNLVPEKGVFKVCTRSALRFKEDCKKLRVGLPQYYEKQEPTFPIELIGQSFTAEHFGPNFVQ